MHARLRWCALAIACGVATLDLTASGSYIAVGVRPLVKIDSARYELGKAVFTGKAKLAETPTSPETQSATLAAWQKGLPASVQKTTNLPGMAGKLTAAQLDGLKHYLEVRYNLKTSGE